MFDVETLWSDFARPIVSADDYSIPCADAG